MRSFLASIVCLALFNLAAAAIGPGYLVLDLEKRIAGPDGVLFRRDDPTGTFDGMIYQNDNKLEYMINITVGTPPQKLAVTLDTGSSDLWIPASTSSKCKSGQCDGGSFNPQDSSTYKVVVAEGFNITYAGPGDSDAGDWSTDTITVAGSSSITGQTIGVALDGYDTHGVMGLGFDTNEAPDVKAPNGIYPSVLDNMQSQNIIDRRAYSLYLNEYNATVGAVIFGGVDTTKYTGELVTLPLQAGPEGRHNEFYVTLTSVSFTDHVGAVTQLTGDGFSQSALLDSGTTQTNINNEVYQQLVDGFGAVSIGGGATTVPCDYAKTNATLSYQFGGSDGVVITVPISQVIGAEYYDATGFTDASGGCDFGFGPPLEGVIILGDTFLRSAYVVFDLEHSQAALAQAAYGVSSTSSIVAIPRGTSLPGASRTASAVGTQLRGNAATSDFSPMSATYAAGTTLAAGTPTFNLGISQTTGTGTGTATSTPTAGASSSVGFAVGMPKPTQAALIGAGLFMGAMVL